MNNLFHHHGDPMRRTAAFYADASRRHTAASADALIERAVDDFFSSGTYLNRWPTAQEVSDAVGWFLSEENDNYEMYERDAYAAYASHGEDAYDAFVRDVVDRVVREKANENSKYASRRTAAGSKDALIERAVDGFFNSGTYLNRWPTYEETLGAVESFLSEENGDDYLNYMDAWDIYASHGEHAYDAFVRDVADRVMREKTNDYSKYASRRTAAAGVAGTVYKVVYQGSDGSIASKTFSADDVVEGMEAMGFSYAGDFVARGQYGINVNGHPMFNGVLGPMGDSSPGDPVKKVRYETDWVYDIMSR